MHNTYNPDTSDVRIHQTPTDTSTDTSTDAARRDT